MNDRVFRQRRSVAFVLKFALFFLCFFAKKEFRFFQTVKLSNSSKFTSFYSQVSSLSSSSSSSSSEKSLQ